MRGVDASSLRAVVHALSDRFHDLVDAAPHEGLRGTDLFVLRAVLSLGDDAFPTAIGHRLDMRRSNVSVAVRSLERLGLVVANAERSGGDSRRRPVRVTERGRAALRSHQTACDRWLSGRAAEVLTASEAALLRQALPLLERLATIGPSDEGFVGPSQANDQDDRKTWSAGWARVSSSR